MEKKYKSASLAIGCFLLCISSFLAACSPGTDIEKQLQRAEEYRQSGKPQEAIIELKNNLQANPSHGQSRLLLGLVYIDQHDGKYAEKELQKALSHGIAEAEIQLPMIKALMLQGEYQRVLDLPIDQLTQPEHKAEALVLQAFAHLGLHDLKLAETAFQQALEIDTAQENAYTGLALLEIKTKNYTAAEEQISQAIALGAGNVLTWTTKGELALQRQAMAEAETAFRTATRATATTFRSGDRLRANSYLLQVLLKLNKNDEAQALADKLLTTYPNYSLTHYLKALVAYNNGDLKTANEQVGIARSTNPSNDAAIILHGAIAYDLKNLELANQLLSDYISRHPGDITAGKLLASIQLQWQQPQQALDTLSPLLQKQSGDDELLSLIVDASRSAGKAGIGIALLKQKLENDPANRLLQLKLARAYLDNNDLNNALVQLEPMPASEDAIGDREILLTLAYLRKRDYQTALEMLHSFLNTHPDDSATHNLLGAVYLRNGNSKQARSHFEKSLALQPANPSTLVNLARLELKEKHYEEASTLLNKLLEIKPDNPSTLYALANIAAITGEHATAVDYLEQTRSASKTAVEPRLILIKYYLEQENIILAQAVSAEVIEINPARADVWNTHSVVQAKSGNRKGQIRSLQKAHSLDPKSTVILLNLARAQIAENDAAGARESLQKLHALQPQNFKVASMLAVLEFQLGNADAAFSLAKKMQSTKANRQYALALEGDLHRMANSQQRAVKSYQAALSISAEPSIVAKLSSALKAAGKADYERPLKNWLEQHPDDINVKMLLASAYAEQGNNQKAMNEYESILTRQPDNAAAKNNLAWLYFIEKDPRALATAEEASRLQPNNGAIMDTLGWILVQNGNPKRGVKVLSDAASLSPNIPSIHYHYAVALAKTGKTDEARKVLSPLVKFDKGFPELEQAKNLLNSL